MSTNFLQQTRRTAALLGAAAILATFSTHVHAQALNNLFGGTTSNSAASASVVALGLGTTDSGNVALGSGFTGRVVLPGGVLASASETVNTTTTPNALTVTAGGISLGTTFAATRNIANVSLLPNTQYQFAVNTGVGNVSLLGGLNFTLGLNNTVFVNTSTGAGLLNLAPINLLGLLSSGSASFTFTTPAIIPANSTLNFNVNGNLGVSVGLGTSSFVLSGASITPMAQTQVPEPGTLGSVAISVLGLTIYFHKRRARQA